MGGPELEIVYPLFIFPFPEKERQRDNDRDRETVIETERQW